MPRIHFRVIPSPRSAPHLDRYDRTDESRHSGPRVELKQGLIEEANTRRLVEQHVVSTREMELVQTKVFRAQANLRGLDEDLADELARLNLEIKKKKAEIEQAQAQRVSAVSVVARNQRLNDRKPGMVDVDTVSKGEGELRASDVQVRIKAIELEELELRVQQLETRR